MLVSLKFTSLANSSNYNTFSNTDPNLMALKIVGSVLGFNPTHLA